MNFNALLFLLLISIVYGPGATAQSTPASRVTIPSKKNSPEQKSKTLSNSSSYVEQLVITGTRTERPLIQAPVKTEVITAKTISENHHNDLSEAISQIPGIHLQNNIGQIGTSAVIQGLGENHVLIMVDSVPLIQKSSNGYDLSQISLGDIERIEVVKGAASSLYGSQAMGGVVNIITKKIQKRQLSLDVKGGATGSDRKNSEFSSSHVFDASFSNRAHGLGHKISISENLKNSLDTDSTTMVQDAPMVHKTNASLSLDKEISNHTIAYLNMNWLQTQTESEGAKVIPGQSPYLQTSRSNGMTRRIVLRTDTEIGEKLRLKTSGAYETIDEVLDLEDNPETSYIEKQTRSDFSSLRTEVQIDFLASANQTITTGLLVQKNSLDQNNTSRSAADKVATTTEIDNKSNSSVEFFIQDDIIFDSFEITPGARIQQNEGFGSHTSPKISLLYPIEFFGIAKTNIRASMGTGYRVPSLKERFYILDHRHIRNYIVHGNSELEPETSVSYQIGAEFIPSRRLNVHINFFNNDVDNLIDFQRVETNSTLTELQSINIKKVRSYGAEISLQLKPNSWIKTDFGYTFTKTVDQLTGLHVMSRPTTLVKFGATVSPTEKLDIVWRYKFRGDEFTNSNNTEVSPRYSVNDLNVNYNFSKNMSFYTGVDNIFDVKRDPAKDIRSLEVNDNRPTRGTFAYLGFKIRG